MWERMRADLVLDVRMSRSCRIERAPGLTHLCRFAHRFSQLLSGLRQQARRHIAFGHVGAHHKHRHDDFSSVLSSPPSLSELQMAGAATQPQRRKKRRVFLSQCAVMKQKLTTAPPSSLEDILMLNTKKKKTQTLSARRYFCVVTSIKIRFTTTVEIKRKVKYIYIKKNPSLCCF